MSDDPTRWSRECTGDDFIDDFKRALGVEQFERCERPALNTVPMGFHYARWKEKTPAGIVEHVATIIFRECQPCSLVFRTWEDEPRACPGCEASEAPSTNARECPPVVMGVKPSTSQGRADPEPGASIPALDSLFSKQVTSA